VPRSPDTTVQVNLRIKESLRRKLEREANKHQTSLNNEMRLRLEDSFKAQELRDHGELNQHTKTLLERQGRHLTLYELQQDLIRAMEKTTDPEIAKLWTAARAVEAAAKREGVS
jgi:hypothetical protein